MDAKSFTLMVLGDRDYPLSPQIRVYGDVVAALNAAHAEGQQRLPDLSYDDVIRLVLRLGLLQVDRIFQTDGRIERGGHISFAPAPVGKDGKQLDVKRASFMREARLNEGRVLVSQRPPVQPPQPQGPKDTIPQGDHAARP